MLIDPPVHQTGWWARSPSQRRGRRRQAKGGSPGPPLDAGPQRAAICGKVNPTTDRPINKAHLNGIVSYIESYEQVALNSIVIYLKPDELVFTPADLHGMTLDEALEGHGGPGQIASSTTRSPPPGSPSCANVTPTSTGFGKSKSRGV